MRLETLAHSGRRSHTTLIVSDHPIVLPMNRESRPPTFSLSFHTRHGARKTLRPILGRNGERSDTTTVVTNHEEFVVDVGRLETETAVHRHKYSRGRHVETDTQV